MHVEWRGLSDSPGRLPENPGKAAEDDSPHEVGGDAGYPPLHTNCECDVEPQGKTFDELSSSPIDGSGDDGLTVEQQDSVDAYQGGGFGPINAELRSPGTFGGDQVLGATGEMEAAGDSAVQHTISEHIANLDAVIASQPPTTEMQTVYRTMSFGDPSTGEAPESMIAAMNAVFEKGTTFSDAGFVSTSTVRDVAEGRAEYGGILMKITVPSGTRMLDMNAINPDSIMADEHEMLLPRGSSFHVYSANLVSNVVSVTLKAAGEK